MNKTILMAVAMLWTLAASAQETVDNTWKLKPLAGITFADVSEEGVDTKIGFAVGVEASKRLSKSVEFSIGAIYAAEGGEDDGVKINLNYINIPVLYKAYVSEQLAFVLGLQPGFKTSAKASSNGVTIDLDKAFQGTEVAIRAVDLAIPVGLSYEYHNLVFDARYNLSVTRYASGEINNEKSGRNRVFQLTLGYKFNL